MEKDLQEQDFSEFMAKLPVFALIKVKAFFLVVAGIVTKKFWRSSRTFFKISMPKFKRTVLFGPYLNFTLFPNEKKTQVPTFFQLWSKVDYFPQ